jgi:hypothetical protein
MLINARRILPIAGFLLLLSAGEMIGQADSRTTEPPDTATAILVSPSDYLGYPVGADFKLAGWDSITGYFNQLANASPSLRLDTLGASTRGAPFILATVTAPENMARLEQIRANQAKLADPRMLADGELETLLETQPAVLLIAHNIHSTEIASSQGVMELAYTLVSDPSFGDVLQNVVVLLIPSVNPDGQQMVVDWYSRTIGSPYEGSGMPWLYHPYVGHDNNRDWFMLTQVETRLLNDLLYDRWFPEVVYDVHQMGNRGARFFIPPFADPVNPNIDPLVVRSISLFGVQVSTELEAAGKPGVVTGERFSLWWHGGLRTAPARHNMVGVLSESASARLASPIFQEPGQTDRQPERGVSYPNPWPGGWWRIRDIIDYQLIAARAMMGLAARQRKQLIRNYVELGRRAVEAGESEPPFAYIIPTDQTDVGSAADMLEIIRRGGVEVHQARAPFEADGMAYEASDWVILMAQPYRAHAKDLLEPQSFPDRRLYPGGPPRTPYDATGWTLPLQMGVEAIEVKTAFEADLTQLDGTVQAPAGTVTGSGSTFLVSNAANAANLAIHRTLTSGGQTALLSEPVQAGGREWAVGTVLLQGSEVREILDDLAEEKGLFARSFSGDARGYTIESTRVGLYQPWTASMDEGWTRWVFEQWELPFATIHDAEIRAGDLNVRYDIIVLPDLSPESIKEGRRLGTVPAEYAGGLGEPGTAALRAFVRAGGTLVCFDSSCEFAIDKFGLPVKNVRPSTNEQRSGEAFFAPGSILAVTIDPSQPLAFGMPEEGAVYYSNSPIFEPIEGDDDVTVVARFAQTRQLLSGYAINTDYLAGRAALMEVRSGEGRVVLFGFRPQHRAQSHETFKLLFNAIYRGAVSGPAEVEF